MPIEQRAGQARPFGLPNFQQFEPVGTGTAGLGSGERRGNVQQGGAVMHPLARNLIGLMEQARQKELDFHPQWWMFGKISEVAIEQGHRRSEGEDFRRFFYDIHTAYGIAAYGQFKPPHKQFFREELRHWIREFNIGNVTLSEQQRIVLQHIGAATNTPIDPAQETYHFYTVLQQPDVTKAEVEAWYCHTE